MDTERRYSDEASHTLNFEDAVVALGIASAFAGRVRLESTPLLAALREAGTSHVYADTASTRELADVARVGATRVRTEIDGNTVNQPLARKVLEEYLDAGDPRRWADSLRRHRSDLGREELLALLYAIVCGRIGNDFVHEFAGSRTWEVSLQLHMGLGDDPRQALQMGRRLRKIVPSAIVKVPFTPHAPHCLLVARDLQREGIPVNFTSTFSARQAVVAALLADVARTNVFMGRLNGGLEAELLGEHVCLEAQRALHAAAREHGTTTQLIVASVREWQALVHTAGCDVYTVPCEALEAFLTQDEVDPSQLESALETSYEKELSLGAKAKDRLGADAVARLWRVEPELVEFLASYRGSDEYGGLRDGEELARRFEAEGFGDLFHAPEEPVWKELRETKVPDLDGSLHERVALDTLFTLHADADFDKHQEAMDAEIARRVGLA